LDLEALADYALQSQPSSLAGTFESWWDANSHGWKTNSIATHLSRAAWKAALEGQQYQPVIEPLVEVVQKLVDTNFWHPFSLPLSRAQQDIINMANNALQQFRKAQGDLGK
jgi:hypothetical protein